MPWSLPACSNPPAANQRPFGETSKAYSIPADPGPIGGLRTATVSPPRMLQIRTVLSFETEARRSSSRKQTLFTAAECPPASMTK